LLDLHFIYPDEDRRELDKELELKQTNLPLKVFIRALVRGVPIGEAVKFYSREILGLEERIKVTDEAIKQVLTLKRKVRTLKGKALLKEFVGIIGEIRRIVKEAIGNNASYLKDESLVRQMILVTNSKCILMKTYPQYTQLFRRGS
jgi:hypothetical protein